MLTEQKKPKRGMKEVRELIRVERGMKEIRELIRVERGMKEIRELIREGSIRLSVSDKGGEFVVIPRQLDIAVTNKHLEDAYFTDHLL
ncbi:hypothetical protein KIN20_025709 [Parelaphostrongylus tenuis]|uniref:Uncharacterized protein n=1 Tax=Parelaphostrongylus tenuis TaxID=148309 RepID=A0AAD5MZR5_PARTN|nr:hypothetical protein KIN20_025709 [Parelaphostrongylus tenuis]